MDRAGTDTDGGRADCRPEQGTVCSLGSSQRLLGGKSKHSTHTHPGKSPEGHPRYLSVSDLSGFFRPEKEHEQSETNLIGPDSANSNISYHGN